MTREELNNKINGLEIDEDVKISLMEDVSDLADIEKMEDTEKKDLLAKIEGLEMKAEELKEKYKARFLTSVAPEQPKSNEDIDDKIIDIKEI